MAEGAKRPEAWSIVRSRARTWQVPLLAIEWSLEWTAFWLGRLAIIDVAKALGALSVIWAALSYLTSGDERTSAAMDQRKIKHYQAWQMIFQAEGRSAGGGRREALLDLVRDSVSLSGANLDSAFLDTIDLSGADLSGASFRDASLRYAFLESAALSAAALTRTDLIAANLVGAQLNSADLRQAMLLFADLGGATLYTADLRGAIVADGLRRASQLDYANLYGIDAPEAVVRWALDSMAAVCVASDSVWNALRTSENDTIAARFRNVDACRLGSLRSSRRYIIGDTAVPRRRPRHN